MRTLKKARFIISYYQTDQVDVKKNQIDFEKKNSPTYDNDNKAKFENLLKQEI